MRAIHPTKMPRVSSVHWIMPLCSTSERSCTSVAEKVEVPATRIAEISTKTHVRERTAARQVRL